MAMFNELVLEAKAKLDCPRVIAYPESYVPIIVPKEEVEAVKRLLGKDRVLQLSPELK